VYPALLSLMTSPVDTYHRNKLYLKRITHQDEIINWLFSQLIRHKWLSVYFAREKEMHYEVRELMASLAGELHSLNEQQNSRLNWMETFMEAPSLSLQPRQLGVLENKRKFSKDIQRKLIFRLAELLGFFSK